ncbi:MAG: BMP family ABC transporter substrate-binding protein, partial [Actinomycetota bacterium]|nr:BMP family ABC transporter substrate-binding protein [Actinomycetota bacterium]
MKKILLLLIVMMVILMIAVFTLSGCKAAEETAGKTTEEETTPTKEEAAAASGDQSKTIALVCSAAGANDNGYNQTAIDGLKQLKSEKGVEYKVVEATTDYPGTLKTLAESGYKLIFSLEYDFTALIEGVGGEKPLAEQFPDTTFVVFNANPNLNEDGTPIHNNVISVMFNVNEASFLAGALSVKVNENAGILFDSPKYAFTPGTEGRKVGFIGGTQSAGIEVFSFGYAEGVNYAAAELGKDVVYYYYSTYDAGFVDTAQGATIAGTYYNEGANIVYCVAGSVGDGVDAKAKEVKKLSIQVDANKDNSQPGYILTSVLKNTNVPVLELGPKLLDGTLAAEGGKEISYALASGATGITDLSVIESAINTDADAQAKWSEIKTYIDNISAKIKDGSIKVTNA